MHSARHEPIPFSLPARRECAVNFSVLTRPDCFSMPPGPRPVQTEVNAMRILLRDPDGHLHLMQKAPVNGRIFFWADGRRSVPEANWIRFWQHVLECRRRCLPGTPIHRPAARCMCPMRQVRHTGLGRQHGPVIARWCPGECLDTHSGDVSPVYVVKKRNFAALFSASR
jgi:hypothetical protein